MNKPSVEIPKSFRVTDQQFEQLAVVNRDIRLEKASDGELIVMSPTGAETGNRNVELATEFVIWNRKYNLGKVFDSSTGFKLPNGATRSPDVSWVAINRWNNLTEIERQKFAPICPDFVLELRSSSDSIAQLSKKMQEYIENGALLGWLINPQDQEVEIYRPNQEKQILKNPIEISAENILPNFTLKTNLIW